MSIILNQRCAQCNKVSSELIETNLGDFSNKRFFRDEHHNDVLCEECKEIYEELMLDYESKDDPWRHYANDNSGEIEILVESEKPEEDSFPFYEEDA